MRKATVLFFVPLFIFAVLLQLPACNKAEENIPPAIQALINKFGNCICEPFISEYKWRNQAIYISSCSGPACNCAVYYYNENGERVNMDTGYIFDHFKQEAEFIREIWRCKP